MLKSMIYKKKAPLIVFLAPAFLFIFVFLYYPFFQNILNTFLSIGGLGRAPATVAGEVARHRFVTAPRARHGEPAPEEGENPDEPKKKRYPHQKAPKNLSTDQFLEKLKETGGATPVPAREHRRRRGRGGRPGEENSEAQQRESQRHAEAPQSAEAPAKAPDPGEGKSQEN